MPADRTAAAPDLCVCGHARVAHHVVWGCCVPHQRKPCECQRYRPASPPADKPSAPEGKHTPGEWHVGDGIREHVVYSLDDLMVAQAYGVPPERRTAAARLVASAPAMLEALRECIDELHAYHEEFCDLMEPLAECDCLIAKGWRKAKAAIRQATGEGE